MSSKPSISSIDQIPWSALGHAYGPADDVPEQIRGLLNKDQNIRRNILAYFTCNIFHQGDRFEATVAAIPFLIEMLLNPECREKAGILDFLAHVAVPTLRRMPSEEVNVMIEAANPFRVATEAELKWMTAEQAIERAIINRDCYMEVAAGTSTFIKLLDSDDPQVVIAATFLLARFPLYTYEAGARLYRIVQNSETYDLVRAGSLMCLAFLNGANAKDRITAYCTTHVADVTEERMLTSSTAAAVYYLLCKWDELSTELRKAVKRLAFAVAENGVSSDPEALYLPPESSERFDMEPRFPWDMQQSIKHQLQVVEAVR